MSNKDDTTIRRILHTHPSIPIYAVPPLAPTSKGYTSAQWLKQPPIFTAALEVVETSAPAPPHPSKPQPPHPTARTTPAQPTPADTPQEDFAINIALNLLDPTTHTLFASAPYTHPSIVTPCTDSSRYFALRVADDRGRKATLGIGFERREEAFELLACLRDCGRVLGFVVKGEGVRRAGTWHAVTEHSGRTTGLEGQEAGIFAIEPPPPASTIRGTVESSGEVGVDGEDGRGNDKANDIADGDDDFGDFQ